MLMAVHNDTSLPSTYRVGFIFSQSRFCLRPECDSFVTLSSVPGSRGTAASCTKGWGSVVIPMLAQLMVDGAAQFSSLALVYAFGFPTLNPTFYNTQAQGGDQGKYLNIYILLRNDLA